MKRTEVIQIRVSPEEKKAIERRATLAKQKVSDYLRELGKTEYLIDGKAHVAVSSMGPMPQQTPHAIARLSRPQRSQVSPALRPPIPKK